MRILIPAMLACCAFAQSAIYVRNAANPAVSSGVAPGSLIEVGIFTQGGPIEPIDPRAATVQLSSFGNQPPRTLPVVDGKSPVSVLAFVPTDVALGTASMQLLTNGVDRGSTNVSIVPTSFALFSKNGLSVAQNISSDQSVEANSLTHPVAPGGLLTLWGTGLGQARRDQVSVTIGGIAAATVLYAGPSGVTDVDQINVQLPDDPAIPEGCYLAVDVQVGGKPSYRGAISYSRTESGSCRHPLGLTPGELQELDAGHSILIASASMHSSIGPVPQQPIDWAMLTRNEGASMLLLDLKDYRLKAGRILCD